MPTLRLSLRWLMVGVAVAAASVAALARASNGPATAVITVISTCLLAAAVIAAAGAGRGQAFAIGFVIGALFYLLLWHVEASHWLSLQEGDLLTDRLVDRFYDLIKRQEPTAPMTPIAGMAPAAGMPGGATASSGMGAMGPAGGLGGMMMSAGGASGAWPSYTPSLYHFRKIAHWLIAFYVGVASGVVARALRSCGTSSQGCSPEAERIVNR